MSRSSTDSEAGEKGPKGLSVDDKYLVTWDGPADVANPQNWSLKRKWAATLVIGLYAFCAPISSTMISPAISTIAEDLHIATRVESILILSIFFLGYSFGVFLLCPLSEVYGRVRIIQLAALFNTMFTVSSGFAQNTTQLMIFRALSGLGASSVLGISGGILSDCWTNEQLGRGMSAYNLAPVISPAVGPIVGGAIIGSGLTFVTWRLIFWIAGGMNAVLQFAGLFLLQETYTPWLLTLKARRLRQQTGNIHLRSEAELECRTLRHYISRALVRPWVILTTQPIIQALAIYQAYTYGLLYLFISSMPIVWMQVYSETHCVAGLNYISLAVGSLIGSQACAPLNDCLYRALKKKYNYDEGCPEFRIPLMGIGAATTPIGIFLYGWAVWAKWHWIVPNIGVLLFAYGSNVCYQCMQIYIIDAYRSCRYSASAFAASTCLRSLAAFSFPLLAPGLFDALGFGGAGSLLGCIAITLGIPAPFLFWRYGPTLRKRSSFAISD